MFIDKQQTPSRRTFLSICAGALTARRTCAAPQTDLAASLAATAPTTPMAQAPEVSLKGKLKGGLMGPGGETTGYALMDPRLASNTVEIDMSSIKNAGKLDGQELVVAGSFQTREYIERGRVLIFKAVSVKAAIS